MEKEDIYGRKSKLESSLKRLKESEDISDNNKTIIMSFYNYCCMEAYPPIGIARRHKYIHFLMKISEWLKKDFDKVTKDDIIKIIQKLEREDYAEWTLYTYKVMIKRFYKWLRKCEEYYPDEVKWIKPRVKNGNHKLPEELLTEDEIKKMVDVVEHPRDKAFIFSLYESGCRISELATLRLKHIEFKREYAHIIIKEGKTGDRRIPLVSSAPLLAKWKNDHPLRDDPNAPLWVDIGNRNKKMMSYTALSQIIKRAANKAGINKRIYNHLFRHSRATFLANSLTESQLKIIFGWAKSSDMPGVYVHLSGRDVDNAILNLNGLVVDKKETESVLKPQECPKCYNVNSATAKFCDSCGAILNLKTAVLIEQVKNILNEALSKTAKKAKTKKQMENLMKLYNPDDNAKVINNIAKLIDSEDAIELLAKLNGLNM